MKDPYKPTSADLEIAPLARGPVGEGEHEVEPGDSAESIAHRAGLLVKTLWDDPANRSLKDARKNPSTLLPGDRYHLPEPRVKEEDCAQEKKHRFRRKPSVARLEIRFVDEAGKPRSGLDYVLTFGREEGIKGKANGDGVVSVEVAPDAPDAHLKLTWVEQPTGEKRHEEYTLCLRRLGPVEEPTGIQSRLRNLSLYSGAIDGRMGNMSQAAIAQFQMAHEIDVTGKADAATISKLKEAYGQ